jgi:hypothetical protein
MPHRRRPTKKRRQPSAAPRQREAAFELVFTAQDFPHHPKNQFWYIGIGLLLAVALVLLLSVEEYLLAAVVVALSLAVFQLARVEPRHRSARFSDRGLYWGDEFYPYYKLRAFWVAETSVGANVYIERPGFSPSIHFVVPLGRVDELVVYLAEYLPWHSHRNEPLNDRLSRLLRF